MSENDNKNNGGDSNANGQDTELYNRAKRAEEALKIAEAEKAQLAKEKAELEQKVGQGNQLDKTTIDERFSKLEKTQQETIIQQRSINFAEMLKIDNELATEILTHFGGDLNKALDESKKANSVFGLAIKQAQHQKSLKRNTPSAEGGFGGEYVVEGKKKNFFDLDENQQKLAYKDEVKRFNQQNQR